MDTITKIRITRCSVTQDSRLLAVVHLNSFRFEKGMPVMVPYKKGNGKIDTMVAIGLADGVGPEYYSIISEGGKLYVAGVYEELPDVSSLVHNVPYIAKVEGQWKLVYISDDNTTRIIGDLDPNDVIYNLEDGHNYYYKDGKVIRDDSILDLLKDEFDLLRAGALNLEASVRGQDTFKKGTSARPSFNIIVSSGDGLEVTPNCEIIVKRGNTPVSGYVAGNVLMLNEEINTTTEYTITATYSVGDASVEASKNLKVFFVDPVYYGNPETEVLWNGQGPLVLYFNLNDEVSRVRVPLDLLSGSNFQHIYDTHGLDYFEDYRNYVDGNYRVFEKIDAVTINNFKQEFTK